MERAVLCSIAEFGKDAMVDIEDVLCDDSFVDDFNRTLYSVFKSILESREKIDLPTLMATATTCGYGDKFTKSENAKFIHSLFGSNPAKENARQNALVLRRLHAARNLQKALVDSFNTLSSVDGRQTVSEIIASCEEPIFKAAMQVSNGEQMSVPLAQDIDKQIEFLLANKCDIIGIPSPFPTWNAVTGGGLRKGNVSLIGARPKTGKTTCALTFARHAASLGIPVLILDTEMSRDDCMLKILSAVSEVPFLQIENGQFGEKEMSLHRVMLAKETLKTLPIFYRNIAGYSFADVVSSMRRWLVKEVGIRKNESKPCLIIYDYFKLQDKSELDSMQEYQALGYQIMELTNFAINYQVPVLAFVQMNREGDVKETSAAISQSDRLLWMCSSFSMLKRKTREEMSNDMAVNRDRSNAKLIPLECRFGPGMKDGDYIKLFNRMDIASIEELQTTKFEVDGDDISGFSEKSS